ncbi:hypothetical protein IFM89_003645 [Coptis chinensis]|uniref:Cation/H+ exchanger transmembrane domain-containing protein n=1 Tax=Coptis chinensis TaxID=261450 RepID=A0A835IY11_9MAGN|nr:hypothetical protein IFM89_003645 [Coptis chinensis]
MFLQRCHTSAETFIFLYVGMDALDSEKWLMSELSFGTSLGVYSTLIFLILLGRAVLVILGSGISNVFNKMYGSPRITYKDQVIIWWAGLMRGAISIALAFSQLVTTLLSNFVSTVYTLWCTMGFWSSNNGDKHHYCCTLTTLVHVSTSGMTASLLLVAVAFYWKAVVEEGSRSYGVMGILSLVGLVSFVVFFSLGIGAIPWVIMSKVCSLYQNF